MRFPTRIKKEKIIIWLEVLDLNHDYNKLKQQLLSYTDDIIKIVSKGNTAEIRQNKDGILVLDIEKKKITKIF